MIRKINIKAENKQELFEAYIKIINWTLPEQLTEAEIKVLSYLLLYNDKYYKEIKSDEVRYDLLFSSNIKKKIREEFDIEPQKFETYLNKLRKKNIIINNGLNSKVVIYITDKIGVQFEVAEKQLPKTDIETLKKEEVVEEIPELVEIPEFTSTVINDTDEDPL